MRGQPDHLIDTRTIREEHNSATASSVTSVFRGERFPWRAFSVASVFYNEAILVTLFF